MDLRAMLRAGEQEKENAERNRRIAGRTPITSEASGTSIRRLHPTRRRRGATLHPRTCATLALLVAHAIDPWKQLINQGLSRGVSRLPRLKLQR